jgi:hypothetical protein
VHFRPAAVSKDMASVADNMQVRYVYEELVLLD